LMRCAWGSLASAHTRICSSTSSGSPA
jgi:hypothetical protein